MAGRAFATPAEPRFVGWVYEQVLATAALPQPVMLRVVDLADLEAELGDLRLGRDLALLAVVDAAHHRLAGHRCLELGHPPHLLVW